MNIRELGAEDLAPLLGLYTHLHEHDDPLPSEPEVQAVWTEALAWRERCYKVMLMTGRKDEHTLRFYEQAGFDRHGKQAFVAKPPQ